MPLDPILSAHSTGDPGSLNLPDLLELVAAGNDGTVLVNLYDGVTPSAMAIDMGTGQTLWSQPDFWAIGATDDGGAIGQSNVSGLWEVRTPSGVVRESAALSSAAQPMGGRWWVGASPGWTGVETYLGLALGFASESPIPWISAGAVIARTPVVQNFSGLPVVIKLEGCEAGFHTLAGASPGQTTSYYPWVDGVMPPQVAGWNAGDWFKIPDWSFVQVHDNGAEPTAFGPSTLTVPFSQDFCRQDDPNGPGYDSCWGRKWEPQWSSDEPGGLARTDWEYPRPVPFDCGTPSPWWQLWKPERWQP